MQCVHHSEHRHDAVLLPLLINFSLAEVPEQGDLFIRKPHYLGSPESFDVVDALPESLLHVDYGSERLEEYLRDLSDLMYFIRAGPPPEKLCDGIHVVITGFGYVLHQSVAAHSVELCKMQMACSGLERPYRLQEALCKSSPYSHHLSGGFHLGAEHIARITEFIERESRELGYYVIERRLC